MGDEVAKWLAMRLLPRQHARYGAAVLRAQHTPTVHFRIFPVLVLMGIDGLVEGLDFPGGKDVFNV